jgi:hypothetical protein
MTSDSEETSLPWAVRGSAGLILVALGIICIFAYPQVAQITQYDALNEKAIGLIDEALVRDQVTFLAISAIKASLAIVEGSTVGIGIEVQVGDIVQPAYDYIDFFWEMFLYAFMVMGFYKLLLETELLYMGIPIIGAGLILLGGATVAQRSRRDLKKFGRACVVFGLMMAYVAPASLWMTHLLSERYTSQLREKHYDKIEAFGNQLDASKAEFLALRNEISLLSPGDSMDELKAGLVRIANSMAESFQLSLLAFLYYILIVLFDLLFFPFFSAWILYKIALFGLDRLIPRPVPRVKLDSPDPA